jgi:hypothetical protein
LCTLTLFNLDNETNAFGPTGGALKGAGTPAGSMADNIGEKFPAPIADGLNSMVTEFNRYVLHKAYNSVN